jgi:biofilm PGA synthesis N-glycosyltransferase PgaC
MLFLINFIFFFTCILCLCYLGLGIFSTFALRKYTRKNSYVNYNNIATSPLAPTISIITPAYNEEKNIINNVKTLLGLHYSNYEVILINDGSTDNTFKLLKDNFKLQKTNYFFDYKISCERIRGIWKSTDPQFSKLIVVDKINGKCKADANNAGLNIARNDLILVIDADSIIETDSLSKLVKPFLEEKKHKVIGAGGVIRILNSCELSDDGKIKRINLPKRFFPRLQVLEYTRAFLLGRMAWAQLDGLLLISGAMGMFDRKTMIDAGGYDASCLGEDMEAVIRIRRYMAEKKQRYEVTYIPDPLCWTEVPSTYKDLRSQRVRWAKGLVDALKKHRIMFFNPKYRNLGVLGYPFWFIFEWLAPIIAFLGMMYTIFLIITGGINWPFFALLSAFIYSFSIFLSSWSILFEELTFHKYERKRDVVKLLLMAFIEPFLYICIAWFSVKGNAGYFAKKNQWGKIRRGLG